MSILTTTEDGKPVTQRHIFDTREKFFQLDTNKPFKLNADTTGFCK